MRPHQLKNACAQRTLGAAMWINRWTKLFRPFRRQALFYDSANAPLFSLRAAEMKRRTLAMICVVVAWTPLTSAFAEAVEDAQVTTCFNRKVAFDGIAPLQYAVVQGAAGERLYFYSRGPSHCKSAEACKSGAYVMPGDTVAVGNLCGDWAYAQFIGPTKITVGWVEKGRLKLPLPEMPAPRRRPPTEAEAFGISWPGSYQFKLTKGRGLPICEAYLQRLNEENFDRPPFCGRSEDTAVPGFVPLKRVWIPRDDVNRLYYSIENALSQVPGPAVPPDHHLERQADGSWIKVKSGPAPPHFRGKNEPDIWRYDPEVDINNDGSPDNVWMWGGDDRDPARSLCGAGTTQSPMGKISPGRVGIIMDEGSQAMDKKRTKEIFGHPLGGLLMPRAGPGGTPFFQSYLRMIGETYGIFEYEGVYYFDTFFDDQADFEDKRQGDPLLFKTLGVFLRRNNTTRQMCEYVETDLEELYEESVRARLKATSKQADQDE